MNTPTVISLTGTDAIQVRHNGQKVSHYIIRDEAPDDVKQKAHRDGVQFIPVRPGAVFNTQFAGAIIDGVTVENTEIHSDGKLQCLFCSDGGVRATIKDNVLQTNGQHFISLSMLSGHIENNRDSNGQLVPIRLFPMRIGGNSDGTHNVYILSFKDDQYRYEPVENIVKDETHDHVTDHRFGEGRRKNSVYLYNFDLDAFITATEQKQLTADEMRSLAVQFGSEEPTEKPINDVSIDWPTTSRWGPTLPSLPKEKLMKTSQHGVQVLMKSEGFRNDVYIDCAGLPTIGLGHCLTESEVNSGKIHLSNGDVLDLRHGPISNEQVMTLLENDLIPREAAVNRLFTVPLAQHQYDALLHWLFNVGESAAEKSTLRKKLNKGDFDAVPGELRKWNKVTVAGEKKVNQGLVNRRETEVALWNGDYLAERGPVQVPEVMDNGMSPTPDYVPPEQDSKIDDLINRFNDFLHERDTTQALPKTDDVSLSFQRLDEKLNQQADTMEQFLLKQEAINNGQLAGYDADNPLHRVIYDDAYHNAIKENSKPPVQSKILGFAVSTGLAWFGTKYGMNLSPEVASTIQNVIVGGGLTAIGVARMWFTNKVLS